METTCPDDPDVKAIVINMRATRLHILKNADECLKLAMDKMAGVSANPNVVPVDDGMPSMVKMVGGIFKSGGISESEEEEPE
jgi:hypothetical protein